MGLLGKTLKPHLFYLFKRSPCSFKRVGIYSEANLGYCVRTQADLHSPVDTHIVTMSDSIHHTHYHHHCLSMLKKFLKDHLNLYFVL